MTREERRRSGRAMAITGGVLAALPVVCLAIGVMATGHQVQQGWETLFFGAIYLGFISGVVLCPMGIIMFVMGMNRAQLGDMKPPLADQKSSEIPSKDVNAGDEAP